MCQGFRDIGVNFLSKFKLSFFIHFNSINEIVRKGISLFTPVNERAFSNKNNRLRSGRKHKKQKERDRERKREV
jgi:hypothetical protein